MTRSVHLTPKSKVVQSYYARLAELRDRDAFQDVLDAEIAKGYPTDSTRCR